MGFPVEVSLFFIIKLHWIALCYDIEWMLTCLALFLYVVHFCFSYSSGKDNKNGKAYNSFFSSLLISVLKVTKYVASSLSLLAVCRGHLSSRWLPMHFKCFWMSVMLCYCCRKKLISSVNKYLLPQLAFWLVKSQSIVTMMCETQELSDSPDRLKK